MKCDVCGKQQPYQYGYDIHYDRRNAHVNTRHSLCTKCANRMIAFIEEALEKCDRFEEETRKQSDPK